LRELWDESSRLDDLELVFGEKWLKATFNIE